MWFDPDPAKQSAIKSGNLSSVQALISRAKGNVNTRYESCDMTKYKYTPLMDAASQNQVKVVKYLIKEGAKLEIERNGKKAIDLAFNRNHIKVVKILLEHGASFRQSISQEMVDKVREKDTELADMLLARNRAQQESNVHPSVIKLRADVATIGRNLGAVKEKQTTQEKKIDAHGVEIGSLATELDTVTVELHEFRTEFDQLKENLNEIMVIIGQAAAPYQNPSYERTLYLTLRWYLSSAYAASFVASSEEGIVPNSKKGTTGNIGNMLETISSHIPMGGGIVVQFFGTIMKSIDAKYQEDMLKHYAKLASGVMSMEALSHNIAKNVLDIIKTLDISKIEDNTNNIAEKCINTIVESISWISDNSDQIETAIRNPVHAAEGATAVLIACEMKNQAVEYFTKEIDKLSKAEQRAQKHAGIIATLLITRIYTGEQLKEYDVISNAKILVEYIKNDYTISTAIQQTGSTSSLSIVAQTNSVSFNHVQSSTCMTSCCIVSYMIGLRYDNLLLEQDGLLLEVQQKYGSKTLNQLIELGRDKKIAEQILSAVDEFGVKKVIERFFDKIKSSNEEVVQIQERELVIETAANPLLEIIAKIEAVIGKEALAELVGWHQYISKALSNNHLSEHATNVIQTIGNLVNNLEEWFDFGITYESIDVDNQVAIILAQLEGMFDFVASGITHVGLPPRYPDFDPDDYFSGGGSSGESNGDDSNDGEQAGVNLDFSSLFIGQNATTNNG